VLAYEVPGSGLIHLNSTKDNSRSFNKAIKKAFSKTMGLPLSFESIQRRHNLKILIAKYFDDAAFCQKM
jgi:hypothetical protein